MDYEEHLKRDAAGSPHRDISDPLPSPMLQQANCDSVSYLSHDAEALGGNECFTA